jgi:hypothetical protein
MTLVLPGTNLWFAVSMSEATGPTLAKPPGPRLLNPATAAGRLSLDAAHQDARPQAGSL